MSDSEGEDTYAEAVSIVKERWEDLTQAIGIKKSVQDKWWDFLRTCYSDPSRKYHSIFHLKWMFTEMNRVLDELQNKEAVACAIFFHDTGYDVHAKDNEERSLIVFSEFCTDADSEQVTSLVPEVEQLIMASRTYTIHHKKDPYGRDDIHYFMDFDVSILGADPEEYKEYTEQVREEYSFLPKFEYNALRIKVLQQFLQIPRIFATELFEMKYEREARRNIKFEIDYLQNEFN